MSRERSRSPWLILTVIIVTTHILAGVHTELLLRRSAESRAALLTDALLGSAEQTLQASHYLEEGVSAKLRSLAHSLASAPELPGPEQLAEIVARNEIRSISIYDDTGKVVSTSSPDQTANMLPESYGCHEILHGGKAEHVFGFSEGMFCEADAFGIALKLPRGGLVRVIADVAFVLNFERNVGLPALIERFRHHPDIRRLDLVDMQGKPILPPGPVPASGTALPIVSRTIVLHGKPVGSFLLALEDSTLSALRGAALAAITISCLLSVGFLLLLRRREFRAEELLEQKRLRDETERRSEGLARVVSGVAHEIRNPLNTLALGLESLQATCSNIPADSGPELGRRFEMLKQTVREANGLVKDLLQTTRPILPHIHTFDVHPWLEDLNLAFSTSFSQAQLSTETPNLLQISSDPELLRRLIWNLISNAAQAGSSCIRLSVAVDARSYLMRIADNGPGLPRQIVEQLFTAGNTTRPDGTGLGLYNAFRLSVALGGTLKLAASGPAGTTFELTLPLHSSDTGGSHGSVA